MSQKEEKMEGYLRLVKPYNCQLPSSTYHNFNKASPRGVCQWKTQSLSQVCRTRFQTLLHIALFHIHKVKRLLFPNFAGGHTVGFSHCSSFQNRIRNFNATHDIDPTLQPSFAASLRSICPDQNKPKNAGTSMDPSSTTFDNTYYKLILQGKGLFSSDQALLTSPKTKELVSKFASSRQTFYKAFASSMIKMSSITGGQEIRKECRVVN